MNASRDLLVRRRLIHRRDLLRELVVRDMKVRYKRAFLGLAWSQLNPLVQLLVFSFVFSKVVPLKVPDYPAFIFCGLLAWAWFHSSLYLGAEAFTQNRELVRRPGFSPAVLPAVRVTSDMAHFLLALPVLLVLLLWSGIAPTGAALFLPVVVALQFLLTLGLVYLFATIQVTFRDTQHLLGVSLTLFFYLTPIFYDARAVPERYLPLYRMNPLATLIGAYRDVLLRGRLPDLTEIAVLTAVTLTLLAAGYAYFSRASHRFWEEL